MANRLVSTIGLAMPTDFDSAAYESVSVHGATVLAGDDQRLREFTSGWNAVAHRFVSFAGHDRSFTDSIRKHGDGPPPAIRHGQEHDLFGCFVTGLSALESAAHALWFVCSKLDPANFPASSPKDLRAVTPEKLKDKMTVGFPADSITGALVALLSSAEFKDWKKIRNTLAHRSAPSRSMFASMHGKPPPALWNLGGAGIVLDEKTTGSRRVWLAGVVQSIMREMDGFIVRQFSL